MRKHILSKKCWCKPDVISFRKDSEDILSDKIFEIASLFNDSMDNDKYDKIRKILKSTQMETEVETGLKNFQVTMKELADARREVITKIKKIKGKDIEYWIKKLDVPVSDYAYGHKRGYELAIDDVLATLKEVSNE